MVLCRFTRGTQGFNARSFADNSTISACVPWRLILLPLRHVHFVHQVHQVHLAKCFVTKTCASAFDRAPGIRLGLFAGAYRQPLLRRLPKGQDGVIPAFHGVARSGRRRVPTFGARWHREAEMVPWHAGRGGLKICGKMF